MHTMKITVGAVNNFIIRERTMFLPIGICDFLGLVENVSESIDLVWAVSCGFCGCFQELEEGI